MRKLKLMRLVALCTLFVMGFLMIQAQQSVEATVSSAPGSGVNGRIMLRVSPFTSDVFDALDQLKGDVQPTMSPADLDWQNQDNYDPTMLPTSSNSRFKMFSIDDLEGIVVLVPANPNMVEPDLIKWLQGYLDSYGKASNVAADGTRDPN